MPPDRNRGRVRQEGDQLGYFTFGGSSYALIFDRGLELEFNESVFQLSDKDEKGDQTVNHQKVNSLFATFK